MEQPADSMRFALSFRDDNTYANPFVCKAAAKQTVLQKYTGRELILPNMTFNDLPSYVNIELNLGKPSKRGFLYSGYCRISDW